MSNCVNIDLDKSLIVQIYDLQQENKQLKDNWNKLIEWVFGEKMIFYKGTDGTPMIRYNDLCQKCKNY